ncbi:pentapeptide repeat-containing protein [Streptomyces scopuliridis]|uniref:Pentapeptide repeat-containing protein n=1 Tax=Streptomyces scopuliridis TaxID=452529 RepID=A0ACD4ZKQ0_9ACTN|nr:pentapeptide repeat-containing protein [Streptomyces scopuliridis]WSB99069.1 pentapeptide repeat-containing protein [Streptomyces scopuliridis]WSC07229.1 pentapeptide repeat-containing protein [Streptomyces scopuliridis]
MLSTLEDRHAKARRRARMRHHGARLLVAVVVLMFVVGLPWVVWKAPYLLDARYIREKTVGDGAGSATLVTGMRTAAVTSFAALGAGIALLYTARTYRLTRRGQVTDRFIKALERLESDKTYARTGGVLALEKIVQDSPDHAVDAARVLLQFVRDEAQAPSAGTAPAEGSAGRAPAASSAMALDVQAAIAALTRPTFRTHVGPNEPFDLSGLHLAGADLFKADLTGADLSGTQLTRVNLNEATLTGANLTRADLIDATLTSANLLEAKLVEADLWGANLHDANLLRATILADLTQATLTEARLNAATLAESVLIKANLTGAWLEGADLEGTDLSGATLTDAQKLTRRQIEVAIVDSETVLPSYLTAAALPQTESVPESVNE